MNLECISCLQDKQQHLMKTGEILAYSHSSHKCLWKVEELQRNTLGLKACRIPCSESDVHLQDEISMVTSILCII